MMERKTFIKTCCYGAASIPIVGLLPGCGGIHYASFSQQGSALIVPLSAFKREDKADRPFVMLADMGLPFPICLYQIDESPGYVASLMKCTHRDCELEVGGGIYSCPCHGSEFTTAGEVIEGPATKALITYPVEVKHPSIHVHVF